MSTNLSSLNFAALNLAMKGSEERDSLMELANSEVRASEKARSDSAALLFNTCASSIGFGRMKISRDDIDEVKLFAQIVIDSINVPFEWSHELSLNYNVESGILIVDYRLPNIGDLPLLKSAKYSDSKREIVRNFISQADAKKLYENVCYQLCFAVIHRLFYSDESGCIKAVAFNGLSNEINPATGKYVSSVILSILLKAGDLDDIDLTKVDARSCFKALKGISATSLASLAPVEPVIRFDKEDPRFIMAKDVDLHSGKAVNLASMDWEDFEHLVRNVFQLEFESRGGEVKVTQSSYDGGVDAVAFDPDPITGGKIIIQAKRYTRPVGVSAVRDLYGTTQAEGASKGILVTTTDYGPDAYKFAQGKPITLLNGANLLYLLEKHGMKARIDVAEARVHLGLSAKTND